MVCVLLSHSDRRADDEEPNPAAKVDRTSQRTDPNSSGDHRFRRRREFAPARGNNSQVGWEPQETQSHRSLSFLFDSVRQFTEPEDLLPEFSHFGNSFMSSSSPRRKIEWDQMACPHAYIKVRANRVALLTVCFVGYPRPHAWEHVPRTNSVQRTIFSDIITLVQQRTIFSWRNSYRAVN